MVPPAAFARGPNAVTAYLRGAGSSLIALRSERVVTYRLEDRDGHVVLVGGGDELPVGAGALKGVVENIEKQGDSLVVSGWAEDTRRGRPAKRLLVFSGDRFLAEVRPTLPRADLPHPSGAADPIAGFTVGPVGDAADAERIRVFAVQDGRAAELPRL